jgi:hypothetical protein
MDAPDERLRPYKLSCLRGGNSARQRVRFAWLTYWPCVVLNWTAILLRTVRDECGRIFCKRVTSGAVTKGMTGIQRLLHPDGAAGREVFLIANLLGMLLFT